MNQLWRIIPCCFKSINILKVSNKILPYLYICLSTIWRLFMQTFYVSKLKLESSAGYNLFALCRIQLMLYSGHFPWHTLYIEQCVQRKKDRAIRSLEWHFPKRIFNPNKKSKRELACSSNWIVCRWAGVTIEIQNTCMLYNLIFYHKKHNIINHEILSKTFLS